MRRAVRHPFLAVLLGIALGVTAPDEAAARQDPAAAAARPAPAPNQPGPARGARGESFLRWMIRASGVIGLVLLAMSFYLVAVVVWMFLNFRRSVAIPEPLLDELAERLGHKQFDQAFHAVVNDRSLLARTLAGGVRRLPSGMVAAQRALELANEDATMEMEHRTTYLATVGTLGPMIGLLGTVYGMIRSFEVIATTGSSPQASQLAEGISTALFATLEGIALSVPAIAFYAFFRNRISRLSLEVQMAAEGLLGQFAQGVRPPHPLVAASTSPPRSALPPKE
jgi:biopolymer transport protein ExbB